MSVEGTYRSQLSASLAAELRAARLERGLSLLGAAVAAGVSRGYLWLLETGQRCPSLIVADALIEALGMGDESAERLRAVAKTDAGRCSPYWTPRSGSSVRP